MARQNRETHHHGGDRVDDHPEQCFGIIWLKNIVNFLKNFNTEPRRYRDTRQVNELARLGMPRVFRLFEHSFGKAEGDCEMALSHVLAATENTYMTKAETTSSAVISPAVCISSSFP